MKLGDEAERILSFFSESDPPDAAGSNRRRIAWRASEALRAVADRLVDTKMPDEEFESLAEGFERAAEQLGSFEHGRSYDVMSRAGGPDGPPSGHNDYSPLSGGANPLAPPTRFWIEGDTVVSEVAFGHAYEGPPGCVHGGIVAAFFDEILGATQAASGAPGMTGTLTVVYRSPSPLHTTLRFEATLDDVQGRKVITSGRSYAPGPSGDAAAADRILCAESTGIFITVDFEKLAAGVAQTQQAQTQQAQTQQAQTQQKR